MKKAMVALCAGLFTTLCFAEGAGNPKIAALTKKLDSIVIPKVELKQVDIKDAVKFIVDASRRHDPDKIGVNIIYKPDPKKTSTPKLSLDLKNVSLHAMLKYVAGISGLSIEIQEAAVVLRAPEKK